jgi:heme A synthase
VAPYLLALATTGATFVLVLVGGIVHATESSLACPDWPTCYGSLMPEMKGGILYEHSHRLLGTFVGMLTVALAVAIRWVRPSERTTIRLGYAAVALVIWQGLLGALTVLLRLPPLVSIAHLGTAMLFLSLLITLAHRLRLPVAATAATSAPEPERRTVRWVPVATVAIYLQIILGAVVRHTNTGLACTDIPLCKGALWLLDSDAMLELHMTHRLWGLVAASLAIVAAADVLRSSTAGRFARKIAYLLPALVVIQVGTGLLAVHLALEVVSVTVHLGLGALLLAGLVTLWLDGQATGWVVSAEASA